MYKKRFRLLAVVLSFSLAIMLSLAGCSKKKEAATGDVFKVGLTSMLSTPMGIEIDNWFHLFAKLINDNGGWKIGDKTYQLELVSYDHGGDPTKHRAALEKLIFEDKVKIILESLGSWQAQSAQAAEQNKVVILSVGYGDETASPKFHYFFRAQGLYFLRGSNYVMYEDFKSRGAKNVLLVNPDNEGGHANVKQFSLVLPVVGLKKLPPVFFPGDTTDFSGVAIKVKEANPDVVDLGAAMDDQIINFVKALKEVGYKGFMYPGLMNTNLLDNLKKTVGKEYIEGFLFPYLSPIGMMTDDKDVKNYIDAYKDAYDSLGEDGAYWTAAWFAFKGAVNGTQSTDSEVLRKYLESGPKAEKTMTGWVQLFARPDLGNDRTIDGIPSHGIGIIKNGEMTFYKKVSVKDQYLMTIICNQVVPAYQKYWKKFGKPTFPDENISKLTYKDLSKKTF